MADKNSEHELCGICDEPFRPGQTVFYVIKSKHTIKYRSHQRSQNKICSYCANNYKVNKAIFERWH